MNTAGRALALRKYILLHRTALWPSDSCFPHRLIHFDVAIPSNPSGPVV